MEGIKNSKYRGINRAYITEAQEKWNDQFDQRFHQLNKKTTRLNIKTFGFPFYSYNLPFRQFRKVI